jgi:parallel beta-helix repeat protein
MNPRGIGLLALALLLSVGCRPVESGPGAADDDDATADDDDDATGGLDLPTFDAIDRPPLQPDPPECHHYADPTIVGLGGDGSEADPWGSLEAIAAADLLPTAGGTLCLLDGFHGRPHLSGDEPEAPLTIRALHRREAVVGSLLLDSCADLVFDGLVVDGSTWGDPAVDQRDLFLVVVHADCPRVTLRDLLVRSADSSESWTREDWRLRSFSGVDVRSDDAEVRDCAIRNAHHALELRGDRAWVEGNLIDDFGGDGIRGLGSGSTYAWNTVRDAYIDDYEFQHDDAFQAYELTGDLRISDVWIHHNRFVSFADPITEFVLEEELIGTLMQGVIITDGYADGWVVENNLVVNSHPHGISLYGARNCRIQNNTVVEHPVIASEAGPWIRITDDGIGHDNFDNVIRNNLATMLTPWDYDSSSTIEANLEIGSPADHFVDIGELDLHLLPDSPAVDAGLPDELSETDLDGAPRLAGDAVDLGAFERQPDD